MKQVRRLCLMPLSCRPWLGQRSGVVITNSRGVRLESLTLCHYSCTSVWKCPGYGEGAEKFIHCFQSCTIMRLSTVYFSFHRNGNIHQRALTDTIPNGPNV